MKKPVTKDDVRADLEAAMGQFLRDGGEIESVPQGVSGRDSDAPPNNGTRDLFIEPRATRTQIPEVIAALEARRKPARKPPSTARRRAKPKQRVVYDDFGEPLRRVWSED